MNSLLKINQCSSFTKKGERCNQTSEDGRNFCEQHRNPIYYVADKPKKKVNLKLYQSCRAITLNKTPCTRKAQESGYCNQHDNIEKENFRLEEKGNIYAIEDKIIDSCRKGNAQAFNRWIQVYQNHCAPTYVNAKFLKHIFRTSFTGGNAYITNSLFVELAEKKIEALDVIDSCVFRAFQSGFPELLECFNPDDINYNVAVTGAWQGRKME
jgi:hypothetical protein